MGHFPTITLYSSTITAKIMNIKTMSTFTSTIEIIDFLGKFPGWIVRISDEAQTLTYQRINDEQGFMKGIKCLESGEEFSSKY